MIYYKDETTGLEWATKDSQHLKNWLNANEYGDDAFDDSTWRLPTAFEFITLFDYNKYGPALKDGFPNIASGIYWTSSYYALGNQTIWSVDVKDGRVYPATITNERYVLVCRAY